MPQVTVTIAGRTYRMACDDGQEEHLNGLARRLDTTIDELRGVFGEIGDQRLTVMSAITVLDQLAETERRLAATEADLARLRTERTEIVETGEGREAAVAERLQAAADRIERIAHALSGRES